MDTYLHSQLLKQGMSISWQAVRLLCGPLKINAFCTQQHHNRRFLLKFQKHLQYSNKALKNCYTYNMSTKITKNHVQINGYLPPQSSGFSAEHACLMVGCSASLRPIVNKYFLYCLLRSSCFTITSQLRH